MEFEVTDAFGDAFDDITSERGVLLVTVFVVIGLVNTVLMETVLEVAIRTVLRIYDVPAELLAEVGGVSGLAPLSLDLPLSVVVPLLLIVTIIRYPLAIVAIRLFASEGSELVPAETTDGLLKASALLLVARLLAGFGVGIGLLLLLIPGLAVLLFIVFVEQEIALTDAGVVEAFRNSFDIVRDNVLGVIVLLVGLFLIGFGIALPVTLVAEFLPPAVGPILSSIISAAVTVFGIATITSAYQQAREDDSTGVEPEGVETSV